jgi:hypothetical protein
MRAASLAVAGVLLTGSARGETTSAGLPPPSATAALDDATHEQLMCTPALVIPPLLAPARPRNLTRVHGLIRPFFNLIGAGGGAIADLAIDHYFVRPFKVGAEIGPTAVALQPGSSGSVTHLRLEGAFVTDFLEVGGALGGRLENFGRGGISIAGRLRLGALDGLNLHLTFAYALIRNRYTGASRVAFSNVMATLEVPIVPRLALVVDGGFSFDVWLYGTVGLKHVIVGQGGPGTWIARAAFGVAWVLDQFPCQYLMPERCEGAAWGMGPTIAIGFERRF